MIKFHTGAHQQPMMDVLHTLVQRLGGKGGRVAIYGGYLRDMVLLGHVDGGGDIDAAMSIADFLALKPQAPHEPDYRRDFVLHEPHLLFMLHQLHEVVFSGNPKPIVLALKSDFWTVWGLGRSVGITLTRDALVPEALIADADLATSGILYSEGELWVTRAFLEDMEARTMTLVRCNSPRQMENTLRRVRRLLEERYQGWRFVVPERFRHFLPVV